jgi:pyruvate, water dikinase
MHVPLHDAHEESRFGGKAAQLAVALRAGLPVPPGFAFSWDTHEALCGDDAEPHLAPVLEPLGHLVAVRSSAVGEDSEGASFAGQHATVLGVRRVDGLLMAVREVHASARGEAVRQYRVKLGLDPEPRMGVVVQRLVPADVAGVLFTRDPTSGEDVRVVEASWGLGEAVVQGLVTPDRYVMGRSGRVLVRDVGEKDRMIRWSEVDGTEEVDVPDDRVAVPCLDEAALALLDSLAQRCEAVFGGAQDIEFAFHRGELYLLQRRAITRGR